MSMANKKAEAEFGNRSYFNAAFSFNVWQWFVWTALDYNKFAPEGVFSITFEILQYSQNLNAVSTVKYQMYKTARHDSTFYMVKEKLSRCQIYYVMLMMTKRQQLKCSCIFP